MALSQGTKLGPYEIVSLLGSGGMGEVYRARDSKLGRDVAVKILPDLFVADPERVARFQREAQLLASLNHPHIAGIYSLEEADASRFLVMELVDGETLARRLARARLPVNEALAIARQIVDALEAAHDKGIVHRDLKPGNIALTAEGEVKVLDFGLAKAMEPDPRADATNSPTLTFAATQAGVILGTAAYMSPEQAKGRAADKRSDVWAFGCVLFEMLAGQRAFEGEDVSDTLAAVLRSEPQWDALSREVSAPIRTLLKRCLEKDRRARIPDMAVVRFLMADAASAAAASPLAMSPLPPADVARGRVRRVLPWAVAGAAIAVAAVVLARWAPWQRPQPAAAVVRFPLVLPEDHQLTRTGDRFIAISPDGSRIVYVANRQLYLRSMGDMEVRAIPGTNVDAAYPSFSPDGQWIAFTAVQDSTLKKIAVSGGAPLTLCKADFPNGLSWEGDQILFGQPDKGIMRVYAEGGEPEVIARVEAPMTAFGAQALDGKALLFSVTSESQTDRWDKAEIVVQSLGSGERKVVVKGGSDARYLPTGHLVYVLGGTLLATRFNLEKLVVEGGPVPVVEGVARATIPATRGGAAQVAISGTGTLAYLLGRASEAAAPKSLALADRDGRIQLLEIPPQPYFHPRLAPDGSRLAVAIDDGKEANVWVYDLEARGPLRRLTFGGRNSYPIWSPDGRYIAFQSDRGGDLAVFRQLADGSDAGAPERLTKSERGQSHEPESWSPTGNVLSFDLIGPGNQGVWTLTLDGDKKPTVFVDTPGFVEKHSAFSPNGRWLAHMATAGGLGDIQVFVQPFPPTGARYQITTTGGRTPVWSRDGKQLFYHDFSANQLMVVDIQTEPTVSFGKPTALPIHGTIHPQLQRNYDVTPDGKHFLVVLPASGGKTDSTRRPSQQINVVLNWFEELKARVPTK